MGHADSQRLQPTQSSVRGDEAIWPALHSFHGTISKTKVKMFSLQNPYKTKIFEHTA